MSEIAVRIETLTELRAVLSDGSIAEIEALLPPDVSAQKFLQIANTAARTTPELARADKASLFSAVVKCATAGLMPDGEEAALAPFGGKVTFMPMIAGYRKVAGIHGWDLRGYVVHETDDFEFQLGDSPWVRHATTVKLGQDRGPMIGAYAVATHRDGSKRFEVMDAKQIGAIKAKGNKALWTGPFEFRMWEKTPAKALFKRLPLGEKEADRLRALLEDSGAMSDAAALLYGVPVDDQQAGPAALPQAGPVPGPDFDFDSLDVGPTSQEGDGMDAKAGEAVEVSPVAADTPAPGGPFAGQPIREIAAGADGRVWLVAVLASAPAGNMFRDAVEAYARAEDTALWQTFEQQQEAA